MVKKLTLIIMLALLLNGNSFASGFQINEHGAKAMSLAGAFTALANDPSAVYFNPAGITQLYGTQFMGGVTLIAPSSEFTGPTIKSPFQTQNTFEMESQLFTPFNLYVTHQLNDKLFVGLGVNNPFGLGTKWKEDWGGRYLAIDTEIRSFFFTPVIAYKVSDQFSVSAGARIAYADVKIIRAISLADPVTSQLKPDATTKMEGDGTAYGFTFAVLFKPSDKLSFGLNYQSEVKFDFEGEATTTPPTLDFTHPLAGPQSIKLPYGNINAPLTTPQNITAGIAIMPSDDLTVTADFQYVGWSSYDKLEVNFESYRDPSTGSSVVSAVRDYENSFILRGGAEYKLSPTFDLRGGLIYDSNPVKDEFVDPTLPESDRLGLNLGFGYDLSENLTVDVAYLLLLFSERTVTNSSLTNPDLVVQSVSPGAKFNGTYNSTAHLFGIDFKYKF